MPKCYGQTLLTVAIFAICSIRVSACLWPVDELHNSLSLSDTSPEDYVAKLSGGYRDKSYWLQLLNSRNMLGDNYVAVALIRTGQIKEAIDILTRSEQKSPGNYITAANLGTAYELAGDDVSALKWIKTGILRNPDSHFGTEWLHVEILEAKLALKSDPKWVENNSVLGLDHTRPDSKLSVTDSEGRVLNVSEIQQAIEYQLHERMEFVKPPDPIVADLLFDLSKIVTRTRSPEHGYAVLSLAKQYGFVEKSTPTPSAQPTKERRDLVQSSNLVIGASLVVIITLCLVSLVIIRRKFR